MFETFQWEELDWEECPDRGTQELRFCCPECGNDRLNVIQKGVEVIWDVVSVWDDGRIDLGDALDDDVEEEFYQCDSCEYRLRDDSGDSVQCKEDLAKWLKENCEQDLERTE